MKNKKENYEIPILLDALDDLQNSQMLEETKDVVDSLIAMRERMIPHLKLQQRDSSFIHYFAYYVIPYCDTEFVESMWNECSSFFYKEDTTEYTDLIILDSLIQKNIDVDKIVVILNDKYTRVYNSNQNKNLILDYLKEVNILIRKIKK